MSAYDDQKAAVKCDEHGCGWAQETTIVGIRKWLHAPCPECGKGEIVTDDEIAMLATIVGLAKMHGRPA